MSNGGRPRALVSVVAVVVGFSFVWTAIEILRSSPGLRLLVVLVLLGTVSSAAVATLVVMYMRAGKEVRNHDADALVSAVKRDRRLHCVD